MGTSPKIKHGKGSRTVYFFFSKDTDKLFIKLKFPKEFVVSVLCLIDQSKNDEPFCLVELKFLPTWTIKLIRGIKLGRDEKCYFYVDHTELFHWSASTRLSFSLWSMIIINVDCRRSMPLHFSRSTSTRLSFSRGRRLPLSFSSGRHRLSELKAVDAGRCWRRPFLLSFSSRPKTCVETEREK